MPSTIERLRRYSGLPLQWASDTLHRPLHWARYGPLRLRTQLQRAYREQNQHTRHFDYDPALLPNAFVAALDQKNQGHDLADGMPTQHTGYTVGYPAWNLLYYALYTSLHFTEHRLPVIVETGTNWGLSTIIMAQVLKDLEIATTIQTVEIDGETMATAQHHAQQAGLEPYITFHCQDSLIFLQEFVQTVDHLDFVFLDGNHDFEVVKREFDLIYPLVAVCKGKVYFDNTNSKGVKRALDYIKRAYGGNVVEFRNCSWSPPGNAIWQP